MSNIIAVAKRELASFFDSPIAYIVVSVYIILSGALFFGPLFVNGQADMRAFFSLAPLLLIMIVPFLTMRLLAEERAQGTLDLLLTMPITDWEVVLGKFFAVCGLIGVLMLLTLSFPITVAKLGPLDVGATVAAYIGMALMAMTYAAIGLMASSFTRNQIVAALIALFIGFGLYIVGHVLVPMLPPALGRLVSALSVDGHFESIARGVIDTRDLFYFLSVTGGCLLIAESSLESRRWR